MPHARSSEPRVSANLSPIRTGPHNAQELHGPGATLTISRATTSGAFLANTCFSVEPGIYLPSSASRSEVNMLTAPGKAWVTGRISGNWSGFEEQRTGSRKPPARCGIVKKEWQQTPNNTAAAKQDSKQGFVYLPLIAGWLVRARTFLLGKIGARALLAAS